MRLGCDGPRKGEARVDDFAAFVAERADALLRYGYVLSGNPHDAADLTQEALIRLHRAWSRVRGKRARARSGCGAAYSPASATGRTGPFSCACATAHRSGTCPRPL
ncbi:sigma factor [Nonomuraea sp. NPDC059007]|uniref:sigma factor n=1 Tax=Nonomuraea sp. NPDC059007 TaxID=3346692 RepID=UPI00369EA82A